LKKKAGAKGKRVTVYNPKKKPRDEEGLSEFVVKNNRGLEEPASSCE